VERLGGFGRDSQVIGMNVDRRALKAVQLLRSAIEFEAQDHIPMPLEEAPRWETAT
jgi:hypothetical protein